MKFIFPTLVALASASSTYRQTGVYLEKNFDYSNMQNNLQQAMENGYNRFYIGFYMSRFGCTAGCADWAALEDSQRQSVKSLLASYNATLYLSVGGPGEFWENCIDSGCAATFGPAAGTFAQKYLFDGVEINTKLAGEGTTPSAYALDGGFISVAEEMVSSVKSAGGYTTDQMAIAANAPYFSPQFVGNDMSLCISTLCLDANAGQAWGVSDCNLVMYNEDSNYVTYNDVFIQNAYYDPIYAVFGAGSAVKEVMSLGISADNVAIVKPITQSEETVRSGYVTPNTLGSWGCNAQAAFGWTGGFIGWTWNSASDNEFNKVIGFSIGVNQECNF